MQLQSKHKAIIKTTFGAFLLVVGIIGLIFPILPGWWVILIGLQVLGLRLVINRNKPWTKVISIREKTSKEKAGEETKSEEKKD